MAKTGIEDGASSPPANYPPADKVAGVVAWAYGNPPATPGAMLTVKNVSDDIADIKKGVKWIVRLVAGTMIVSAVSLITFWLGKGMRADLAPQNTASVGDVTLNAGNSGRPRQTAEQVQAASNTLTLEEIHREWEDAWMSGIAQERPKSLRMIQEYALNSERGKSPQLLGAFRDKSGRWRVDRGGWSIDYGKAKP